MRKINGLDVLVIASTCKTFFSEHKSIQTENWSKCVHLKRFNAYMVKKNLTYICVSVQSAPINGIDVVLLLLGLP